MKMMKRRKRKTPLKDFILKGKCIQPTLQACNARSKDKKKGVKIEEDRRKE